MLAAQKREEHFRTLCLFWFWSSKFSFFWKQFFKKKIAGNHDMAINQKGNRSFCFLIFNLNLGGFSLYYAHYCLHVKMITQKNALNYTTWYGLLIKPNDLYNHHNVKLNLLIDFTIIIINQIFLFIEKTSNSILNYKKNKSVEILLHEITYND